MVNCLLLTIGIKQSKFKPMKVKPGLLLFGIIFALVLIALVVYFAAFPKVTLVRDESWNLVMPKGSDFELAKKFLHEGKRLRAVTFSQTELEEPDFIETEMKKLDTGGIILASPVVTAAVNTCDIDIKNLMQTEIIGMGINSEYFDSVLISDTLPAWVSAAKIAAKAEDKVAVIYDSNSIVEAKLVYENIGSENIYKYNKDEYGEMYETEIKNTLTQDEITLVFCPPIDGMYNIVKKGINQNWIVDYRYSLVIPEENLMGVICPDVYNSLKDGKLEYEYRSFK